MRPPKSTSYSPSFAVAFACIASLAGCAGPLRDNSGTGGSGATAGTGGSGAGTTGSGGTGGTIVGGTGGSTTTGTAGIATGGTSARGGDGGTAGAPTGTAGTTGTGGTGGGAGTGVAGGGAGGGTAGTGGTMPSRGPTPAANGVNFPFPQNRELSRCAYPTNYLNSDVMTAWTQFKADTVVSAGMDKDNLPMRRIQRTASDPVNMYTPAMSTVSEGIGYAMTMAVFMGTKDDQSLFDDLWRYSQAHLNGNGLMNWAIASNGTMVTGMGGATDADEDIAFALLMADKQWGGKGSLKSNYIDLAKSQINNIWLHEIVDSKLAGPGDSWGPTNLWNNINISYFAPAYYRLFKVVDSGHAWDAVVATVYDTILSPNNTLDKGALKPGNMNTTNGLVPAWCTSSGDSSSAGPFNYQYDSCRTPFRIALDWCWFGEPRAQMYLQKIGGFFSGIGAANVVDGYDLNGNRHGQFFTGTGAPTLAQQSASFLGPAGVGAMVSNTYQTFITESYQRVATGQLKIGGAYYDESWAVMSLLMMTGNFLDYTSIQPVH
jgi:endo-1,4-beta-D-glucanase Y